MAVLFSDNTKRTFDGSSGSYHTTSFDLTGLATTDFTVETFVKYTGTADRTWTPALGGDAASYSAAQAFFIGKRTGNTDVNLNIGGLDILATHFASTGLFDGSEHHLAVIRDRTNQQVRLYVDYALAGTISNVTGDVSVTSTLLIGAVGHATGERWVGDVGPVRISDEIVSTNAMLGWETRKITVTDLKAPNDANAQVANATGVQVKLWIDKDDVGAPDVLVTDATITSGVMTVNFDTAAAVGTAVLGVAKWEDSNETYFFPIDTIVEDESSGL
jgi:hypothetical protein